MSKILNDFNAICDSYELEIYVLDEMISRVRDLARAWDVSGDQQLWRCAQDLTNALDRVL